jgi:hypothetical protein
MAFEGSIATEALQSVQSFLADHRSSLSGPGLEAITALLDTLEIGLIGELDPVYFLSSIEPGMGKTLSVSMFLKAWKDRDYLPASSVLIGVSRLSEIKAYVDASGLAETDFGILTSDTAVNDLGVPKDRHGTAPILFTTQQMIERRSRGKVFSAASEFHYQDEPRTLRIWDESLIPGNPQSLSLDQLGLLASPLRYRHGRFVEAVEELQDTLRQAKPGEIIEVPECLSALAPSRPPVDIASVLKTLQMMAGSSALLVDGGSGARVLIGSTRSLPEDFVPAVILDASGRVRTTYDLWEQHRHTLRRLPSAQSDYSNLTVRLWKQASGKMALENPANRSRIADGIAQAINDADPAEWLIVHYKGNRAIFDEVTALVENRALVRLHSLTWGQHHGTNDYADIPNVVIVGRQHYGEAGFHALGAAASGLPADRLPELAVDEVARGEFKHHLLQAVCRSSVRRSRDGKAGKCRAFIVTTGNPGTELQLEDTFPGCRLWPWRCVAAPMTGRRGQAADYLCEAFGNPKVDWVRKGDLCRDLGIDKRNLSDVIKHPDFKEFLGSELIFAEGQRFVKQRISFDAYPGGGWEVDGDD